MSKDVNHQVKSRSNIKELRIADCFKKEETLPLIKKALKKKILQIKNQGNKTERLKSYELLNETNAKLKESKYKLSKDLLKVLEKSDIDRPFVM